MKLRTIAFFGGHALSPKSKEYQAAKDIAKFCARQGLTVLNGGGPGIMRASTEGAHLGGGQVIGITTYYGGFGRPNFEGVDKKNNFDKEIIADDYFERTKKLLRMGDIHIIFKGGPGTISEFGMTWIMSSIHEGNSKPIILFGDFWHDIFDVLSRTMLVRQGEDILYNIAETPEKAKDLIRVFLSK